MADLEAVLADVSYLMAMEKSKSTPAARASRKIVLPDHRFAILYFISRRCANRRSDGLYICLLVVCLIFVSRPSFLAHTLSLALCEICISLRRIHSNLANIHIILVQCDILVITLWMNSCKWTMR